MKQKKQKREPGLFVQHVLREILVNAEAGLAYFTHAQITLIANLQSKQNRLEKNVLNVEA
jgi:hypothetical protein